jgi:hypothetical protein
MHRVRIGSAILGLLDMLGFIGVVILMYLGLSDVLFSVLAAVLLVAGVVFAILGYFPQITRTPPGADWPERWLLISAMCTVIGTGVALAIIVQAQLVG